MHGTCQEYFGKSQPFATVRGGNFIRLERRRSFDSNEEAYAEMDFIKITIDAMKRSSAIRFSQFLAGQVLGQAVGASYGSGSTER